MLRRQSTDVTPNRSSSPLTSSPVIHGGQSLNLVPQQPFRASTFQTVEPEPFVSTPPPVQSRPVSPLQSPSGNSGARRKSFRNNTQDTLWGVTGRSASTPKPATRSGPGPPPYETAGTSEGIHAEVWPTYIKASQEFDEKRLGKSDRDLDILLVFSALWSGIVTSFLIRSLDDLGPDYQELTVRLLYQSVNGVDMEVPDPTIPTTPDGLAVAVNTLWCISLTVSIGATVYAMSLKWWLTDYGNDVGPVSGLRRVGPVGGLRRACRRHTVYKTFERLYAHVFIAVLPGLLLFSINVFTLGGALFFWQLDRIVLAFYSLAAGFFLIVYLLVFTLPSVANLPFFRYSTLIPSKPSSTIGKAAIFIVDGLLHIGCSTLRHIIGSIFFPIVQIVWGNGTLHHWYRRAEEIYSKARGDTPVQPAIVSCDNSNNIDTSQEAQAEAILWLSQVPLEPSESRDLVSSLALISPSHPYGDFQKSVVALATLVLEAWHREGNSQDQIDTAISSILVLGNAKFQAAVDQDLDHNSDIGGIPVPPFVAWVAQWFTIEAFRTKYDPPYSEEIRAQLLAATAWLSPVGGAKVVEDVGGAEDAEETKDVEEAKDIEWNGLKIQDRQEFIKEVKAMLEQHIRSDDPLDSDILIGFIHGMHASIPRGDPKSAPPVVPFLSIFCENHDSTWSEDEAVVRALITYALDFLSKKKLPVDRSATGALDPPSSPERKQSVDRKATDAWDPPSSSPERKPSVDRKTANDSDTLPSPSERKPLFNRKITFDNLASELIDALRTNTTHLDVVIFAFSLVRLFPHEFSSRETVLADIAYIWRRTDEGIQEDHRERLRLHATDAFIAIAPHYAVANDGLSVLTDHTALNWLSAALESRYNLSMTIYTMAAILNLGTSIQPTPVTDDIEVGSITDVLFSGPGDLEKGAAEKDVVDTRIYSTLILLKLLPKVELNVEKVKGLIVQMEGVIGDPSVSDPEAAKSSKAGIDVNLDRTRWKAIYLLALLFKFLPGNERERHVEGLRTMVRTLADGKLSLMGDYWLCLEPLGRSVLELGTPPTDEQGRTNIVFKEWIGGFPLLPLTGVKGELRSDWKYNRPSFFNPRRWFR